MKNSTVPLKIYENVKKYFEKNDMPYDVQEIIPDKSPFNDYLFIVIAKHRNYPELNRKLGGGPWVVYGCWNDTCHSLNHGHYDILDYDKAYALAMDLRV